MQHKPTTDIVVYQEDNIYPLIPLIDEDEDLLIRLGQDANRSADRSIFQDYQNEKKASTLRRQQSDLALFALYITIAGAQRTSEELYNDPLAWRGVTHGLILAFRQWMLTESYAISSINFRLSTVRTYAKLAAIASVIPTEELAKIDLITGYSHDRGINVDEHRLLDQIDTRRRAKKSGGLIKKAMPVTISPEQVALLKDQPDTPQGRRDALLMCLLLDHGLRCGEVADLRPENIDLSHGQMIFYREKVKKTQKHKLSRDTLVAAIRYFEVVQPVGLLLVGSRKGKDGDNLQGTMNRHSINKRVRLLGTRIGLRGLGPHDCRHAWVDRALAGKTDLKALMEAGGWTSLAMVLLYSSDATIANEDVRLA